MVGIIDSQNETSLERIVYFVNPKMITLTELFRTTEIAEEKWGIFKHR